MKTHHFLFFVLLCVWATACKNQQPTTSSTPKRKAKKEADVKVEDFEYKYLTLKSKVTFDDGSQEVKASADMRICKDSILWISLSSKGVEGVRAVITPDSVRMINRINKTYMAVSMDSLSRLLNFNVTFDMLQNLVVGNLSENLGKRNKAIKTGDYFLLSADEGHLNIESQVSTETDKLQQMVVTDKRNQNNLSINYTDFQQVSEMLFPHESLATLLYKVNNIEHKIKLELVHLKVIIQDKPMKFPFKVASRYQENEEGGEDGGNGNNE